MKVQLGNGPVQRRSRKTEDGMAVIVVLALWAIMLLFLGMSLRSLNHLRVDLKLIERQQLQRIYKIYNATNSASVTNHFSWTGSPPFENR